jgi:hypothetical protein
MKKAENSLEFKMDYFIPYCDFHALRMDLILVMMNDEDSRVMTSTGNWIKYG